METKKLDCCIICAEELYSSNAVTLSEDILKILKFLIVEINVKALQNSLMCEMCLEKINKAYQFKTAYLEMQREIKVEITGCDENFIICYICKNSVKQKLSIPLFSSLRKDDPTIVYLISKEELENLENPQICDTCQISLCEFHAITNLLSVYDGKVANSDQPQTKSIKAEICDEEIKEFLVNDKFNLDAVDRIKAEIKEELEQSEEDAPLEDLQIKPEELDLKMDFEAGPSGVGIVDYGKEDSGSMIKTFPSHFSIHEINNVKHFTCSCEFDTKCKCSLKNNMLSQGSLETIDLFSCNMCEFKLKCLEELKRHMLTHTMNEINTDGFACNICNFKSNEKSTLTSHMLTHKSAQEIELFACNICEFKSKYKGNLSKHMLTHKSLDEIKLFCCSICEFRSKFRYYFKSHMLSHKNSNEVELFSCNICEFKSRYKRNLKAHMLTHKSVNECEFFCCNICEFKSKQKCELKTHVSIHKSKHEINIFACNICEFKSKFKRTLKKHKLCHKSLDSIKYFKRHRLSHKLFMCNFCDFKSKYKRALLCHMLTHES